MSDNKPPSDPDGSPSEPSWGQPDPAQPSYGQTPDPGRPEPEQAPDYGPPPDYQAPGYQNPGYQNPGYQAPAYGSEQAYTQPGGVPGQPQRRSVLAMVSLITGILGIPCCGWFVFSIAAVITGILAKREIRENGKSGAGLAQAGLILGIVGIVIGAIVTVLVLTGVIDTNFATNFES